MNTAPIPLKFDDLHQDIYGDFGSRLVAIILDVVFLAPLGLLEYLIDSAGINIHIGSVVLNFVIVSWYQIYLVKKYGGTPGKLLAGLKIFKLNGETIGWKEALLRHSVGFILALLSNAILIYALTRADETHYLSLVWLKKYAYLVSFFPMFFMIERWLSNLWTWSEFIVLLTNKKKRALHDFIAGTVVIKIKYLNYINQVTSETPSEPNQNEE